MKKLLFLMIPVLALLTACQTGLDQIIPSLRQVSDEIFYASLEEPGEATGVDTKVYADAQMHVLWNADDQITIFNRKDANQQYRFEGEDGDNAGTFKIVGRSMTGNVVPHIYAVYPFSPETAIDAEGTISLSLPAEQTYKANSFGLGANTMVSVTDDELLLFKNLGGYLSFKLYGNAVVEKLILQGNNNEKLAGASKVTMALNGTPSVAMQDNAVEYINLNCDTPVYLNPSIDYYTEFWFVLPPIEFKKGFTVTVIDDKGRVFVKSTDKAVSVSRNALSRMALVEVIPGQGTLPITDKAFKDYCIRSFDTDHDGQLSLDECAVVERIEASGLGIATLQGIENFPNLKNLSCPNNELTVLDLSRNNKLQEIDLGFNHIRALTLPRNYNINLNVLRLNCNELMSLDVSTFPALTVLDISNNPISEIDLTKNYNLYQFYGSGCHLSSLNLPNSALYILAINDNPLLGGFDLSYGYYLEELYCGNIGLTSIDLSVYQKLRRINLGFNPLTSINLSKNTNLEYVDVSGIGNLTSLDVSALRALTELRCPGNRISSLNLANCLFLKKLDCSSNQITQLEVVNNPYLDSLNVLENPLQFLYVANGQYDKIREKALPSGVSVVEKSATGLVIDETSFPDPGFRNYVLRELDVSGDGILTVPERNAVSTISVCTDTIASVVGIGYFSTLSSVSLYGVKGGMLADIDVSMLALLNSLNVSFNALKALDVSKNLYLVNLNCDSNLIESLNLSQNTSLKELHCQKNKLSSLDVSYNRSLTSLDFRNNSISAVNLSKNKFLAHLWCNDNSLNTLDVSSLPAIAELHCRGNAELNTLTMLQEQEIATIDKDDFTQIVYVTPPIPQFLVGESGTKAWKWNVINDACWGNCGYIGVGGQANVAAGEIPGYWWGCPPADLETVQIGHAGGVAYGYGDKDAYMVFKDNGDCISYKSDGTQIVKGTFSLRFYDPECCDGYKYGTLVTTNAPILMPFKINSGGQRVNEFEVIYLDAKMMSLIHKGDNVEWGWGESTWWRFKAAE